MNQELDMNEELDSLFTFLTGKKPEIGKIIVNKESTLKESHSQNIKQISKNNNESSNLVSKSSDILETEIEKKYINN